MISGKWFLGWMLLLCLGVLALAGCGGGGGGSSSTASSFKVFASDDMNTGYDHVWVTIDKVTLLNGTQPTVLFDLTSSGGITVDLRTLHDSSGARFCLLGSKSIPAGTYTGITVTTGSSLSIVPTGSSSTVSATFAGSTGPTIDLGLTFPAPKALNAVAELDVDFNLAAWTLSGGQVSALNNQFLKLGDDAGLGDPSRHEKQDVGGTVSNLSGSVPAQTFSLGNSEYAVTVATTASTSIFNSDGSASPSLANGEHVHVSGAFDPTTGNFDATSVEIFIGQTSEEAHAKGLVTASDATSGTLTLTINEAEDFLPSGTSLQVTTSGTTLFFASSGLPVTEAQFFAALTSTSHVEAAGAYSSGTLAANMVRIEEGSDSGNQGGDDGGGDQGGGDHHHLALIQGTASAFDPVGLTATITVSEWEGVTLTQGASVNVTMTAQTVFRANGQTVTATAFAALLTSSSVLHVEGTYDTTTSTFAADNVRLVSGNSD